MKSIAVKRFIVFQPCKLRGRGRILKHETTKYFLVFCVCACLHGDVEVLHFVFGSGFSAPHNFHTPLDVKVESGEDRVQRRGNFGLSFACVRRTQRIMGKKIAGLFGK